MAKSQFVKGLDSIQAEVNSVLKPLGFKKSGRTHNRLTKGGLTHVLDFQKPKVVVGEHRMFPQFWRKAYGEFAVNLGIFLPCIYQIEQPPLPEKTITLYHCSIRQRLGHLAYNRDRWFEITDDNSDLTKDIVGLVQGLGIKFLDRFQAYEDILSHYQEHGCLPGQNVGRSTLEAALIANHLGDKRLAQSFFKKAYASQHERFRKHVSECAKRVGFKVS